MKKLTLVLASAALIFASCSSEASTEEVAQQAKCDATNLESAVDCICDLYNQLDDSDALSDEEYNALYDRIDAFNAEIDKAIEDGKYTVDDLYDQADKISCRL
jgi:flagellar hook-associated protein FlgK